MNGNLCPAQLEDLATAYHEAGHAIVGAAVGITVSRVTIVPHDGYLGRVWCEPPPTLADELAFAVAGPVAEVIARGDRLPADAARCWSDDDAGAAARLLARDAAHVDRSTRRRMLREATDRAARVCGLWWPSVRLLADLLVIHREVTGATVHHVMSQQTAACAA